MFKPPLAVLAGAVLLTLAACGPDTPAAQSTSTPPAAVTTTTPAQQATSTGFSPDQVCGLVTVAQMSQFTGFTISSTRPDTSGTVSVCHFIGTADGSSPVSKVIIEYQPDGKGAVEFTKARGEAVSGLGEFAVYFSSSAQLSVELGGDAVFLVFIEDVRAGHGNPKGAAVQIARTAVPGLTRG